MNSLRSRVASILPNFMRCYCSEAPKRPRSVCINRVQILGYLGRDPWQLRGGDAMTRGTVQFSMATNQYYTDAEGQKQPVVEWHRVIITDPHLQEIALKHLRKSNRVLVNGRLKYLMREAPGSTEKISVAGIRADEIIFLDMGNRDSAANRFTSDRKFSDVEEEKDEVEVEFHGEQKKEGQSA